MREHFQLETQQKLNWCWAAVTSGIAGYLGQPVKQCAVATKALADREGLDFCRQLDPASQEKADVQLSLGDVFAAMPIEHERSGGPLEFDELKAELDAGRPVCARIAWVSGGGHFVVICGYRHSKDGKMRQVFVTDPFFADSLMDYEAFRDGYQNAGEWTHTYRFRKSAGEET